MDGARHLHVVAIRIGAPNNREPRLQRGLGGCPPRSSRLPTQSLGLKGLVWLGGYDNTTCSFVWTDDQVRTHIAAINGHPAIRAYEIDNEPHADTCPTAPQIKERVALVRSLVGPNIILYRTLSKNFQAFADSGVDLIRISAYPCSYTDGCVMQKIVDKVAAGAGCGIRPHLGRHADGR